MIDRRVVLASALYLGGLGLTPAAFASARLRPAVFRRDPFLLGVASGYPHPNGMVLWTRLIADLLAPDGGVGPDDIEVGFTRAEAIFAHSVHLEVRGLEPGRSYYYRFRAGEHRSAVGRTWTCPAAGQPQLPLRIGVASCQHYEQGYYHAYRHMLETGVDLIAHLGDYIYEGNTAEPVRRHDRGECQSLADYPCRLPLGSDSRRSRGRQRLCRRAGGEPG